MSQPEPLIYTSTAALWRDIRPLFDNDPVLSAILIELAERVAARKAAKNLA